MRLQTWTVGVDFGGTDIKVGLVDQRGYIRQTISLSTVRVGRPPAVFAKALGLAIEELTRSIGVSLKALRGIGVGVPGLVDSRRGTVHHLVNVRGWRNVPLARVLARKLHIPCVVDNDVNLMTLGEWRFGAGQGAKRLLCLTLGTGVGGGLVICDRLYRGASGSAGEIGHMVIAADGRRCACGNRGCLETQVGTAAIVSKAREALRGGAGALGRIMKQTRGRITPELVCQAAAAGDRRAQRIWKELGHWLGVGLANAVNLLNPNRIVIGGGIAPAWPWFYPSLIKTFRLHAMDVPARAVRIVRAKLGNNAAIVGGAVFVWQRIGDG